LSINIKYIPQTEIDKTKWNSCVHYATNGNMFGYMWYLNNTAKEWDALIENDYESVMPIIKRSKYLNVEEIYQPSVIREAGIYSINSLSPARINAFMEAIPSNIKVIEMNLNERMHLPSTSPYKIEERHNYQLLLNDSYETIIESYSPTFEEKLTKASELRLSASTNFKPEKIVDFYKKYTSNKNQLERRYHQYLRIMYNLLHRGWGFASGIMGANQELLAIRFFMYGHNKVVSLLNAVSPEGKKSGADALLIDLLLRSHATKPMILDFNGSDDVAKHIGAQQNIYQNIKLDKRKWGIF